VRWVILGSEGVDENVVCGAQKLKITGVNECDILYISQI